MRQRFAMLILFPVLGLATEPSLIDAVKAGDSTVVIRLLRTKPPVNAAEGDGTTALHWAALKDEVKIAQALLNAGADPAAKTRDEGLTPFHLAASTGDAALVDLFLKAGADPNVAAANGTTPLMKAAAAGNVDAVRVLLAHGAAVNAREQIHDETSLMFAAAKDRAAVVSFLLAHGADASLTTRVVKLERRRVDEDGNPIAETKAAGNNAKRKEYQGGFARGAAATVMGGLTALHLAARDGNAQAVRALVEGGANVNEAGAGDKSTPLVIAICNGHYDVARYLVEHGADPNLASIDGLAALYATEDTEYAQVGWAPNPITIQEHTIYLELLKILLAHHANPNAKLIKPLWFRPTSHQEEWVEKRGITPFWRAAMADDVEAMKILLDGGADPAIASDEGVTPLMVAAGLGWAANASRVVPDGALPAVQFLLDDGADVNARDKFNYTALHGAAYRGENAVVELLIAHGARLDVRSKRGQTVTDMANGPLVNAHLPIEHPETIALLEKHGAPRPELPSAGAPAAAEAVAAK
ncbi:MAG: ankyrin repeat domain-containing protein [Acidobacteriaceae bacterium]|nr:ankyrin repeat domain-containing protein [Acidobacteriaceae bacterium]